jgi:hypothetical protein
MPNEGKAIALVNLAVSVWSVYVMTYDLTTGVVSSLPSSTPLPSPAIVGLVAFLSLALPFVLAIDAFWCWSGYPKAYFAGAIVSASLVAAFIFLYFLPPPVDPLAQFYLLVTTVFSALTFSGNVLVWNRIQKHDQKHREP